MSAPRRFDWDEAKRLRADGVPVAELAERFGVTIPAIYLATDAALRARQRVYHAAYQRRHRTWVGECIDCGGPAANRWAKTYRNGRCRSCAALAATSTVREDTLLCTSCGDWKPDEAFSPQRAYLARRGRHAECKACAAARKRALRAAARMAA